MTFAPFALLGLTLILSNFTYAAGYAPKVGRNAAAKYFQGNGGGRQTARSQLEEGVDSSNNDRRPAQAEALSDDTRFLTFGLSNYVSSDSYKWGLGSQKDIGKWGVDMTYRLGVWNNSIDEALRVSYTEYELMNSEAEIKRASKMSFLYTLILPDAGTKFPLYFGLAFGPGIFFKQFENESPIALDYQLFFGLRIFNLFDNAGFYVEAGMKNHLQLTSDGQVNGNYLGLGGIFTF
ncbi:MAG: hypothetical protein H7061_06050 [Bdellovibrionaceae bacterium]|nr:hypothetical protein [Bdellovibrio sp.]